MAHANHGWRILMILGTTPALLTFLIRLFVPESERGSMRRKRGTRRIGLRKICWECSSATVRGRRLTIYLWAQQFIVAVHLGGSLFGLIVAAVGYSYPVRRYLKRGATAAGVARHVAASARRMLLGAGFSGVALLGTWGSLQWAPLWAAKIGDPAEHPKEMTQILMALGAIVGTILRR